MGGNITIKERLDEVSPLLLGYPDSNQEKQDQNLLCYHYTISQDIAFNEIFLVGIPGLEPGKTGPESVVLPLHHIPRLSHLF